MSYGCAAPIGPGFTIEKQRVAVSYTQQSPDRVMVRASYQLKNNGTKPISVLTFQPPDSEIIQPRELRAEWRGNTIEIPTPKPDGTGNELRIPLQGDWKIGERGELVVSYDIKISPESAAIGSNHTAAFFLPSAGWLPMLLPPRGPFSSGGAPPPKWDLVVSVPAGYHVHASGSNRGADKRAKGAGVRFEQRYSSDHYAYVAAGPYVEQQIHSSQGTVILWTARPLSTTRSAELGNLIATDAGFFETEFGFGEKNQSPIWLIECPQGAPALRDRPLISQTGCVNQPQSIVMPADDFAAAAPEGYMKSVELQLAATLLYFSARPNRYSPLFPVTAIPDYAQLALTVSRNPGSRRDAIRDLLHEVDAIPDPGKPLSRVDAQDSPELRNRARAESILFLFALEDRCGAQNVHKGIARAARLLRGQAWAGADLRSAVEAECGGPGLESLFREWMHGSGVPAEFRARYEAAPAGK